MTDQIREQMSALLDGELPQDEIGLLVRRMERDIELKRAFGSYVLIGETLRAPGGTTASQGFAASVQAVLHDRDQPLPAAYHPSERSRWLKPAAAASMVAGTAFAAVLLLRPGEQPGGSGTPAIVQADSVPTVIADFAADDSSSPTPAQSQRLAGYLVAHSQFATPIGRRNVWTSVLAQDPGIARVAYEAAEGP
jgi:sigma-E factor negative regulatory protein RseA